VSKSPTWAQARRLEQELGLDRETVELLLQHKKAFLRFFQGIQLASIEKNNHSLEQDMQAQQLLAKIHLDPQVGVKAVALVEFPEALQELASMHHVPEVRVAAYEKLPLEERRGVTLANLVHDDRQDLELRKRAVCLVPPMHWNERPQSFNSLPEELRRAVVECHEVKLD